MAFESLKSFGRAAAVATKAAAVAVADVTVKTYNDLQAVPETIKCSGPSCQLQVAVCYYLIAVYACSSITLLVPFHRCLAINSN
jgi:fatty-acid desaturase